MPSIVAKSKWGTKVLYGDEFFPENTLHGRWLMYTDGLNWRELTPAEWDAIEKGEDPLQNPMWVAAAEEWTEPIGHSVEQAERWEKELEDFAHRAGVEYTHKGLRDGGLVIQVWGMNEYDEVIWTINGQVHTSAAKRASQEIGQVLSYVRNRITRA